MVFNSGRRLQSSTLKVIMLFALMIACNAYRKPQSRQQYNADKDSEDAKAA